MLVYLKCMSFVTAGSARSAGASYGQSCGQVQTTILVNNGNVQIGPKVKVSVKFSSTWLITIKKTLQSRIFLFLLVNFF